MQTPAFPEQTVAGIPLINRRGNLCMPSHSTTFIK